jgi:hypothetical protein
LKKTGLCYLTLNTNIRSDNLKKTGLCYLTLSMHNLLLLLIVTATQAVLATQANAFTCPDPRGSATQAKAYCKEKYPVITDCAGGECIFLNCMSEWQKCRCEAYKEKEILCTSASCNCEKGYELDYARCVGGSIRENCNASCRESTDSPPTTIYHQQCMSKCTMKEMQRCTKQARKKRWQCKNITARVICEQAEIGAGTSAAICDTAGLIGKCAAIITGGGALGAPTTPTAPTPTAPTTP